jgi:hypothetical protein
VTGEFVVASFLLTSGCFFSFFFFFFFFPEGFGLFVGGMSRKEEKGKKRERSAAKGGSQTKSGSHKKRRRGKAPQRPGAPRNTGTDLLNQRHQHAATTPSPRDGLNRVFSMSNFQNNYGSNVAFQDLFDDADNPAELAHVDVFSPVDAPLDGGDEHQNALLTLLTHKLRSLKEENLRLTSENAKLAAENSKLVQQKQTK